MTLATEFKNEDLSGRFHTTITRTFFFSDIYAPVVGQSERVDQLLMKLRNKLEVEINFHQKGFELLGTLDTLFATAHSSGGIR